MRTQRPLRERGAAGIVSAAAVCALLAWPEASEAATALADAARDGRLAQVREQIAAGAAVDAPHPDGTTPLLWAVHRGDLEMVEALIGAGASVDAANEFGVTPLLEASRAGDAAIIAALLGAGADVSQSHPTGETPLMAAARTGGVDAVRLLLEHGADANARDAYQHQTALMWAAAEGHLDVVDVLLAAGADPNLQARVSTLQERSINADYPTGGFTALMWAARNGDEAIVRRLVAGGADLDLTNGDGATAMMIAIVNDRFDMAALLLELGAGVDDGSLYYAVEMRDATTDWFARDGSRLRPDHPNEHTALDLIRLLLEAGADPNLPFVGQMHSYSMCCDVFANASPFYRAAVAGDVEAMRLMLEHGADVMWMPSEVPNGPRGANANVGRPAIAAAVDGGRGVSRAGGPGDLREGPPPFREPSNRNPADAVRLLLEAGADPNATVAESGNTVMHEAVRLRKPEVIRVLAEAGVNLDAKNREGLTPLELAEGLDDTPSLILPNEERPPREAIVAVMREVRAAREQGSVR